jgi:hypothetical protein
MANGAAGRLPLTRGCYPPKSEILIHRNFSFQRHSKLFKAVQSHSRIFRNIFLFLCPPATTTFYSPTEWSFDLLWCLEVGSWSFCHGGIRKVLRQPLPSYANLRQPMPATPLPLFFGPQPPLHSAYSVHSVKKSVFYLCPSVAQKSDRFLIFNFVP